MSPWWSWTLAGIGVTGIWLIGSGRRIGWMVGVGVQALWIAYAVVTRQWGFVLSALCYGFVNARGWRKWQPRQEQERCGHCGMVLGNATHRPYSLGVCEIDQPATGEPPLLAEEAATMPVPPRKGSCL